jgi:hypothetical protein
MSDAIGTWSDPRLRVYLDQDEIGADGYPTAWHGGSTREAPEYGEGAKVTDLGVKHLVRELNEYRCERCHHPFPPGSPGEWSPCSESCNHEGPDRWMLETFEHVTLDPVNARREAQWRILTVHHLNGVKHDLRWWNLAALCQRCHLSIQSRVLMERVHPFDHSEWFKPHAAGWYAFSYLGIDISRAEALERMDELLNLERMPV